MPLKLFLFTLGDQQKLAMLEFLFVALYSDSTNEHASHCFQMFSLHVWYFHLHDDFKQSHFTFTPNRSFYKDLLSKLASEFHSHTGSVSIFAEMTHDHEVKLLDGLNVEQLMLHKRMKIMPENQKIAFDFIESLSDVNAYRFYRGYIESNNLDPSAGDTTTTSFIMDF